MNVGSLFTGVGGFDLGLERAGHRVVFQCEADPFRRRVLARHWPGVPCYEDVHDIRPEHPRRGKDSGGSSGGRLRGGADGATGDETADLPVDLLCGGFPCQDLSVAGRRAGLSGERSGLFFEFARVADAVLPGGRWLLIENVPGLLSSNGGRDFAVVLATLGDLGFYDLAWRVLDSRYFGVPQRRRRVYILARRSRGRRASEVLLEPESGGGDFEAGREARKGIARSVGDGAQAARSLTARGETEDFIAAPLTRGSAAGKGVSYPGRRKEDDENLVVSALDRRQGGADDNDAQANHLVAHTLRAEGFDASEDGTGRGTPLITDRMRTPPEFPGRSHGGLVDGRESESAGPQATGATGAFDPRPDGPRYAACGDAVTVNVAEWIGRRLALNETQEQERPTIAERQERERRWTKAGPSEERG